MNCKKHLLLIAQEETSVQALEEQAKASGFSLFVERNEPQSLFSHPSKLPDLILLDIPGDMGREICRRIKQTPSTKHIPIFLFSYSKDEVDTILALELGADDCIQQPCSPKLLFTKIRSVLRVQQRKQESTPYVQFGEFSLDIERYMLRKNDAPIPLTLSEFGILRRLISEQGRVFSRLELLGDIKEGEETSVVDRNIDVHIASLRKKLGPTFHWIETVRGIGYRFREMKDHELVGASA